MGVIDINAGGAGSALTPAAGSMISNVGGMDGANNWLQQAIQFISSINQLISTLNANPLLQRMIPANQSVDSDITAKLYKQSMAPASPPDPQKINKINDTQIMNYLQTPDGMKKIIDALDMVKTVVGDVKLSELKKEINKILPVAENKQLPEAKDIEKPKKKVKRDAKGRFIKNGDQP